MTPAGLCTAAHRTDPDRPRPALGGLQLCAGHLTALTDALTGPSAADDPTIDAVWGINVGYRIITCDSRDKATATLALKDRDRSFRMNMGPGTYSAPPTLVVGDGHTWHDPAHYRPGQLARAYTTLATLLTGHVTTATAHVSGTVDWRLPIADHVADTRVRIRHVLASWSRLHAEELAVSPPDGDHPTATSAWLARYVDWSAAQPWANEYVSELAELHARARSLVDLPQPRRVDVAACVEHPAGVRCEGQLTTRLREDGDPRPAVIECDTCQAEYTTDRWQRLGERIAADLRRRRTAA